MRLAEILTLLAALGPLSAEAQARVVVATEATLATRIRGQIADLPMEPLEAPPIESFEEALARGAERSAPYVVFATEAGTLTIHVVEVALRRMLTREVEGDGPDDRSARLEAAALIVRSALRDLADGGHVGVAIPAREEPAAAPIEAAPRSSLGVRIEAGWSASADGHAPYGVQAPSLAGVVQLERLRLGLRVEVGLPVELTDDRAAIALLRVRPTLAVGLDVLDHDELALALGVELGVGLWHRTTAVLQPGLDATAARWTASLLIAPAVALEVFPAALDGVLGLVVAGGADILPSAPTFAYELDGATVERAALWPVQPWARLAIAVRGH